MTTAAPPALPAEEVLKYLSTLQSNRNSVLPAGVSGGAFIYALLNAWVEANPKPKGGRGRRGGRKGGVVRDCITQHFGERFLPIPDIQAKIGGRAAFKRSDLVTLLSIMGYAWYSDTMSEKSRFPLLLEVIEELASAAMGGRERIFALPDHERALKTQAYEELRLIDCPSREVIIEAFAELVRKGQPALTCALETNWGAQQFTCKVRGIELRDELLLVRLEPPSVRDSAEWLLMVTDEKGALLECRRVVSFLPGKGKRGVGHMAILQQLTE